MRDTSQKKVIAIDRARNLVLAPAGCGKTDILAERVERALLQGVSPDTMLCLTFTNRASRGMTERIERRLTDNGFAADEVNDICSRIFIGNSHRFCSRFLFDNNILSKSTAILDDDDILAILKNFDPTLGNDAANDEEMTDLDFTKRARITAILQLQHLMHQYRHNHPRELLVCNTGDYIDNERTERHFSPEGFKILCEEFDMTVSRASLLHIYDNVDRYADSPGLRFSGRLLRLMALARHYERYKADENVVDFDDLLMLTYEYARDNAATLPRYAWIQVDEVQDLNRLQFAILDYFTAPEAVTVYLGDPQQAIFSFIGAKLGIIEWLRNRCAPNVHRLETCYRSPRYLLDLFNDYANSQLDTPPDYLPRPSNRRNASEGDLILHYARDNKIAPDAVIERINEYERIMENERESATADADGDWRTAVIVSSNATAESLSKALLEAGISHFKISGTDAFCKKQTKLVMAHLGVIADDTNATAWARLLAGLKIVSRYYPAREFVSSLRANAITPSDFILRPGSSYVLDFANAMQHRPVVIFDTETTGVNVFEDDIVQIAAAKYIGGRKVDSINLLLHTDKTIPPTLGDIVNPLIELYASSPHLDRADGLRRFLDFARGCVLVGHNVMYDYNILINNCAESLPSVDILTDFPEIYDTLKLARLLRPHLPSYKLKNLLEALELEGENSHLADEDIVATHSLAMFCIEEIRKRRNQIEEKLTTCSAQAEMLRQKYGPLYRDAMQRLYRRNPNGDTVPEPVAEMRRAYDFFVTHRYIERLKKFDLICRFIERDIARSEDRNSLAEQLDSHLAEMNSYREADLCDSSIMNERIFVATAHKAKGLQFDNVVVYGVVDGTYPFFFNRDDPEAQKEDARCLYVAMTRARRRLGLVAWKNQIINTRRGEWIKNAELSPFLSGILARHPFVTLP